jgi:ATP-dependent protease Clp ATPase subunit
MKIEILLKPKNSVINQYMKLAFAILLENIAFAIKEAPNCITPETHRKEK